MSEPTATLFDTIWIAGKSGLPSDLFQAGGSITIDPSPETSGGPYKLTWLDGEGGQCTMALPALSARGVPLSTPSTTYPVDVMIVPNPSFPIPIPWVGTLSLSDENTGSSGQFIAQASTSGPPPDEG